VERKTPYEAIVFDKLWNEIAGSDEVGLRWRKRYIQITYAAGTYRPYEEIIRQAAAVENVPNDRAEKLIESWERLEPWPETEEVLRRLERQVALAVVTNCSEALAKIAVERTRIHFAVVVSAERAGFLNRVQRATGLP
jgi:2-haloacid dehalogenase